ncbi:MAG: hypothetical protein QOH32_1622 [Bradyrhizobium sp.]|jgi:hypothetical protein|nr:hypothetical protein [Bradyrhizobium sp.]
MSLVFSGALAAAFYTLVLGSVWPAREGSDFSVALLGQIAKSLWLSWLIVVISYWLDLTIPFSALLGLVAIVLASQWLRGRRFVVVTNAYLVTLTLIVTAGLCLFCYFGGFTTDYRLIFVTNDALQSWNQWAIQLSQNTYKAYNTAYPLLFPGIWSLVYKAQGTATVWIFAKLTTFIGPIILGATVCILFASRSVISALIYGIFVFKFFFLTKSFPMFLGDMDIPVAIMCLAAGIVMVVAIDRIERDEAPGETIILAGLFSGLASITKQPGAVMLLPLIYLVFAAAWSGKIGKRDGLIVVLVGAIPLATFMAMFLSQQPDPLGNLERLQVITTSVNKFPLLGALHHLEAMLPLWMLVALSLLAAVNLFSLRRLSGQMGALFLVLGIAGFFAFAKCCAYHERNGWWILAVLVTSAISTLVRLDIWRVGSVVRLPARYLPTAVAALSVIAAALVQGRISDQTIVSMQFHEQEEILGTHAGSILKKTLQPVLHQGDVLVTELGAARWFPGMQDFLEECTSGNKFCIASALGRYEGGNTFVLIRRGVLEYPSMVSLLTPEKRMAESGGFELYGPFHAADAASLR